MFVLFILISTIGCSKTVSPNHSEEVIVMEETTQSDSNVKRDNAIINKVDYKEHFEDINGCAVFYNITEDEYTIYNEPLSNHRSSPCSTFKIISTLMGLKNGIVSSKDSVMGYNGTRYRNDEWNKDLGLEEAFKSSCVWYFRKVVDGVGENDMQCILSELHYGNGDVSAWNESPEGVLKELYGFWLESSLKISPKEQVDVLTRLFTGNTDFDTEHIQILKDIMLIDDDNEAVKIYGKTGTGYNTDSQCVDAWFVGIFEKENQLYSFSIRLDDPSHSDVSGSKAKEIAIRIIQHYYMS